MAIVDDATGQDGRMSSFIVYVNQEITACTSRPFMLPAEGLLQPRSRVLRMSSVQAVTYTRLGRRLELFLGSPLPFLH